MSETGTVEWNRATLRTPSPTAPVSSVDADRCGVVHGGSAVLTTSRAAVRVDVEVHASMREGHVSLPNGLGLDYRTDDGTVTTGVAPNELTDSFHRDPIAGTPFHKHVPARIGPVPDAVGAVA